MNPPPGAALVLAAVAAAVAAAGWWVTERAATAPKLAPAELTVATPPTVPPARRTAGPHGTRLPKLERSDDGLGDEALHAAISDPGASNLPPRLFRRLSRLATDIVIADTTGEGRQRWPRRWGDQTVRAEPCCTRVTVHAAGATRDAHHREAALARVLWSGTNRRGQDLASQVTIVWLVHRNGRWRPEQPRSEGAGATSP